MRFGLKSFEIRIDDRDLIRISRKENDDRIRIDLLDFEHPALRSRLALFGKTGFTEMKGKEMRMLKGVDESDEASQYDEEHERLVEVQKYLNLMVTSSCYGVNAGRIFPSEMVVKSQVDLSELVDQASSQRSF